MLFSDIREEIFCTFFAKPFVTIFVPKGAIIHFTLVSAFLYPANLTFI